MVQPVVAPQAGIERDARSTCQIVNDPASEAGTIIIDTRNTYLYLVLVLVLGNGSAMRYGIGVGRQGFAWSGVQTITNKAEWPDWTPPQHLRRQESASAGRAHASSYALLLRIPITEAR